MKKSFILYRNKLAKARKTRKLPGTLGLKKFGPGRLRVEKVWAQNIFIDFLTELDNFKLPIFFYPFFGVGFLQLFSNQTR